MASRRRARGFALQGLYHADLGGLGVQAALENLWSGLIEGEGIAEGLPPESQEIEFAQRIALGVERRRDELDTLIESASTNWRIPRMPVVDRNILRMACFELAECDDIPATVTINEAIELAKTYGTKESRAFINGIVDRVARSLGRIGARGA